MGEMDSSDADGSLASQEIPHGVWILKLHCLVRRISQLVLTSARLIQSLDDLVYFYPPI